MSGRPVSLIPGQTMIRAHMKTIEAPRPGTDIGEQFYRLGVQHALLWVLNGGEAPQDPHVARCKSCGCTDDNCNHCMKRTGKPYTWVEFDLCSACAEVTK